MGIGKTVQSPEPIACKSVSISEFAENKQHSLVILSVRINNRFNSLFSTLD